MKIHLKQLLNTFSRFLKSKPSGYMQERVSMIFLALGFFTAIIPESKAQDQLQEYLELAMQNNPKIMSRFKAYEASLQKVDQVSLENPLLNVGVFTRPMELLMGNQRAEASVMQMFPWFGMLKTQREEASLMAKANYEAFRQERNEILFQVKEAYLQLQQIQSDISLSQANLELLRTLEELAIVRYQGGNTSELIQSATETVRRTPSLAGQRAPSPGMSMGRSAGQAAQFSSADRGMSSSGMGSMGSGGSGGGLRDVLRLQFQIKSLENELDQLEINKIPLLTKFNQILGRELMETVFFDELEASEKTPGWELALKEEIMSSNPMLQMLEQEQLAYQKQGEMARLEGMPMFGLGLNYMVFSPRPESGMIGGNDGMAFMPAGMGNNMVMPMASVSLPLYRKRIKGMKTEAEKMQESVMMQKEDLKTALQVQVETQLSLIKNADRNIKRLSEQEQILNKILELSFTDYATGTVNLDEILGLQRELLELRQERVNALISKELSYASLESLIGL